jgi:hypothetical protein
LGLTAACPSSDDHGHGSNIPCDEDTRDEEYTPGLEKATDNGLMTVVLDELSPGPIGIGSSDWTISVSDPASGAAESGCTITAVPWMVDHGHGTNEPVAEETATPGTYEILSVEISMAGLWDTELRLECPNLGTDTASFVFCIDG